MNRPSANTKPPVAWITGGSGGIGRAASEQDFGPLSTTSSLLEANNHE
jgi:hypothetical protein